MNLRLLSRVISEPWALRREHLAIFTQMIIAEGNPPASGLQRLRLSEGDGEQVWTIDGALEVSMPRRYQAFNVESIMGASNRALPPLPENTFVFMLWGTLGRAWSEAERYWLDPIDVDDLAAAIAATPAGARIILWFRSPGRIVSGIPETAEVLRTAGKTRRLIAFTDELCASAAYWLAAQCHAIHATPTADLGSIGVYIAFYDWCEYLTKEGIKLELFKAGEMKAAGMMGNPLNAAERAHLEARVQKSYRAFTADVLRNRFLAEAHMQGQTLTGDEALAANLVDAFAPSSAAFFAALG